MKSLITFSLLFTLAVSTAFGLGLDNDQAAKNLIMSGRINHAKGVAIASTATVDLNSVAGNIVHVTGASTITSFGTPSQAGIMRHVIFDGINTLTYNASTLIVPGASNVITAAGDSALVVADDAVSKWIVLQYTRQATAP